jgi:hypothetical protein
VKKRMLRENFKYIRSDPKIFRMNIQALLNASQDSIQNLRDNHKILMEMAPEFFDSAYSRTVDNWFESFGAELKAMWDYHKNDPMVS